MLSRMMLREFIPEDGVYKGSARMSFSAPNGSVSGTGTVTLLPNGTVTVRIDVEQYSIPPEYHNFLMPFLQGALPEPAGIVGTTFRIGGTQKMGSLEVTTANGHFRADRALVGRSHFDLFGNENAWFEVVPYGLEFSVGNTDVEEIWCMPLLGELSEFQPCANACLLNGRAPFMHFDADGHECGLLIFSSEDQSSEDRFSAVVFGGVGDRPRGSADEVSGLIPWGLLAAMDFAFGVDIQAPWIELRGHEGELRRRFHLRFGGNEVKDGFPTFSRFDSAAPGSGITEFLRRFFELPQQHRRSLTPTMTLVRRGAPGNATVDESITNLIKALDATCARHGFGRVNLTRRLDDVNSEAVLRILSEAREGLKKVRRQSKDGGKLDQLAILDRIISRQANAATDELDFGIAVAGLLRKFTLRDGDVMEAYYSQRATDVTWEGLLSSIRGEVIHSGAIHVEGRAEVVSWFEFARHLHDICKRVILLEIDYKGTYAPSNVLFPGTYELDRVACSMTTAQLGYTIPPPAV